MNTQNIKITQIKASKKWNPRLNYEGIDNLAEDIKERGLIAPLIVRPSDNGKGYDLIVGFRRFFALEKIKAETAPCQIFEGSDTEACLINLRENVQREDLTTYELALRCKALKEQHNLSGAKVSQAIGKDRNYINNLVGMVDRLIDPIKKAWSDPKHPAHHICSINRLSDFVALEPEAQLIQWDELCGLTPTQSKPSSENNNGETLKPRRPGLVKLAECLDAIKSSKLEPEVKKAALTTIRWCMGFNSTGNKESKALRLAGIEVYNASRRSADTESE